MSFRLIAACAAASCAALACGSAFADDANERYVLHSLKAAGDVAGGNLRLKIELRAEATTDAVARIPLRLDEAILTESAPPPDAQQYVKDEGARGGYAWYLRGKAQPRQLTLEALVPLRQAAGETVLRLSFPQAQQAIAELKLRIPGDAAIGELLGGELLEEPQRRNGQTEITLRRVAGPLSVSWYSRGQVARESGKLRARTFVRARYDATAREFRSEARISVLSTGGTFSEFQVRLPPGATLAEENPRGLTVEKSADGRGDVVKVRHDPAARYALALSLLQPYDPGGKAVELAKYEVLGTVRQWGFIALEVDDNHQARWTADPRLIGRIAAADLPREFLEELKLAPDDADASFEIFSPQASLTVTCTRSKPRVRVEPDQVVFVERDRLRLEAVLRYATDRAVSQVQFDLPPGDEWQEIDVRPAQLVQSFALEPTAVPRAPTARRMVTVDLKAAAGNSFTLRVVAVRKHPPEPGTATFGVLQMPGQGAAGRLWVQPADDLNLLLPASGLSSPEKKKEPAKTPEGAAGVGTSRGMIAGLSLLDPPPAMPDGVDRQAFKQAYACYRIDSTGATYSARWGTHPRRITTLSRSDVVVEAGPARTPSDGRIRVNQRFEVDLERGPLAEFTLEVPVEVESTLQFDVSSEGKTVGGVSLRQENEAAVELADPRRKRLVFADPLRPGKHVLHLSYEQPWSSGLERGAGRQHVAVPLVMPMTGETREYRLSLAAKDGFSVRLADATGTWRPAAEDSLPTRPDAPQRFQGLRAAAEVGVDALWGAPVVHRLRLDTWLLREKRIDHLACEYTSDRHPLQIRLPPGAVDSLQTTLDSKPWRPTRVQSDDVMIQLPSSTTARTLELRYEVPLESSGWWTAIDAARPTNDAWVHEAHWQLVLPETRHLLWSPTSVEREFSWEWQGWGWVRANHRAPAAIVARGDEAALPDGVNAYVFSTLGPLPHLRVATMDRTWLVLLASGMAFLVGGLAVKLPQLRRRETLFVAVVLAAALALIFPEPVVLALQAASLGLAAIVVVLVLRRLIRMYRPLLPARSIGSTLSSSGVFRGSSAPTRLSPSRTGGTLAGSSRVAAGSSPNGAPRHGAQQTAGPSESAPVEAAEVVAVGSSPTVAPAAASREALET